MSGIVMSSRSQDGGAKVIHRRSSLAASLHSNLLGLGSTHESTSFHVVGSARRRFSNVSDVVSRKLSHTIGWRSVSASVKIAVSQGTSLCGQYIRNRLKRSGIFHRKLGLKRLRSEIILPGGTVVGEVYPELTSIGAELEKMHPHLFTKIGRQVGCSTFSSEQAASDVLTDVSREMLRNGEMTWSKIIALYAVAGGIAVDCVRQGRPEYLPAIQHGMMEVLEDDLAAWIQANGGWSALTTRYRPVVKPTIWQVYGLPLFLLLTIIFIAVIFLYS
ncbi:bcl-2-related ovarian killer protein homolog B-like [Neodiprion virginianus]|uniref:bcl-2-related ovarian killer protein homolog B-like n=1 Tax=Neodiprion virginianus TaxID=2961670 RepID=UPI001EE6DE41|nr:bcl-2-related ovarian killer protein homolog B-like [Neodiprion virginianus]XP_046608472.1 bcl-2-related ovarian killer protein homolog B-like [Neodiprion virginianus]XP_046608473.1 bcl-2-related ovarian killer protein homolog B-like [Neodiprion virginianus]XP_046608474.1 bcl-2-related ovarian killer protein homolog B-like [Neodiprion virginianus]